MAKVWDKPITAETDWGGDASTDNLPVSGRQVQAWIKSNIKSDAQISQLIVSWLNTHTINSPVFWKGLPIDADTLKWENNTLTVIGSDGETEAVIDEEFLINFLKENGYLTKGDYPFVYDAEKKAWLFTGDLITTGAITMFGSIEGFNPSTIMDAVQVDGRTIVKNAAGQLVAIGGGGSGGGLIVDDVNALIEAALVPVQEEIELKWTEDSDSIYRWNLAFSWGDHSKEGYALKTYVDDELTKYILLDTAQDVNAQHNFKKGLFIDGLPITKVNSNTIFLDANVVIGGAITMFGNNSSTFKAIWENIPFDSTMQWNGSTWSVVGGGGSSINESAVNLLIGEYLTNNNYASEQWVSNQGYAKQSSLDGVDNRLKSVETFFATSDTDNLVNKWSEIVTFLNATEGDTLDNILKTKANQSALDDAVASLTTEIGKKWTQNDVKIANWDSAYGWGNHANAGYAAKTYVDGELAKYVKLATAQTISARHNFSDGLQIGGITIRKSQDGTVYIDGNLVIKGALTMFGTDTTIPSSIWASIPFNLEQMSWDGSQWNILGGGSGSVDDARVNVLISEYLAKNSYATIQDIPTYGLRASSTIGKFYLQRNGVDSADVTINLPTKLSYFANDVNYATQLWVDNNYLAKSGGTINGSITANSFIGNLTGNADSATKLQTRRTIWGQSFDGAADIKGSFSMQDVLLIYKGNNLFVFGNEGHTTYLRGNDIRFQYGSNTSTAMTITNGGNVAIGGTTADAELHVHGDVRTRSVLCVGDYGGFALYSGVRKGEALAIERLANHGGWVGMGITMLNNGDVGIGYTTPQAKLHVGGDVKIGGMLNITSNNTPAIVLTDSSRQESSIAFKGAGGNEWYVGKGVGGINDFFGIYNAYKGNAFVIDNNSDVTIYGNLLITGAFTMFSQLSMKNVIDYDGLSLAQLAQIRPARFTWKDNRDNRTHVGVIADYIQPILPEVVYETVNKELTVDYGSAAFYIGTSLIKPVVELWEVKDKQQQEIESLKKRVEYLENENRQLRA